MVESRKAGACSSMYCHLSENEKGGMNGIGESVSKLKFVSSNLWQRIDSICIAFSSLILARPFISAVSDFKIDFVAAGHDESIFLSDFPSYFDFYFKVELSM